MKVVIIQRVLPHYRIPFFIRLQQLLKQEAIELRLIYGQEFPGDTPRTVDLNEPWATKIHNRYLKLPFADLTWQPCWHYVQDADLVIVEQANRLLINYLLQFFWRNRTHKLAFWGHGTNFQSRHRDSLKNRLRRFFSRQVDWWLAYTDMSIPHLTASNFPAEKLTVVQNCIDTENLKIAVQRTSDQQLQALRQRLGLTSQHIGLYCGGLYPDKRIGFLLEACDALKAKVPDFECLIIGEGQDAELVRAAAESRPWLHYLGPIFGDERVPYFMLSRVLLMPGLVGLVIIDSFVTRLPLFTTDNGIHSPEIAYLENGVNGFMSANNPDEYVDEVVKALCDDAYLQNLRNGCALSSEKYSLENMANNFVAGVRQCLASGQ